MYDSLALFMPSNLGETRLIIGIAPGLGENLRKRAALDPFYRRNGEDHIIAGYNCLILVNNVKDAQQAVIKMSRDLEKEPGCPIQSNRIFFLPLFAGVGYKITLEPEKTYERPIIRVDYRPEDHVKSLTCKIYVSNLVQLQEALFIHERNLIQKQSQVLKQRRDGADER